jgi:hypothetical protein
LESLEERTVPQAGLTPNQAFVTEAYQVLLNRAPDPAALTAWSSALDSTQLTRLQVATGIINSQEFQSDEIQNLYQTLLKRPADASALNSFTNFLAQGNTINEVKAFILSSDEYFQNRGGGTNAGFVQALYNDLLGRNPDPAGGQAFQTALANGVSRAQVVSVIITSNEGIQDEVRQMYSQLLQRTADPTGLAAFATALGDPPADPSNGNGSANQNTNGSANGSQSSNASANASASAEPTGAVVSLPTGTAVVSGVTAGTGAEAISLPNVTLPPGTVAILLAGQTLPTGATVLSGITIPSNAATVTVPGVTTPTGTAIVPLNCSVLPDGTIVGVTTSNSNGNGNGSQQNGSASGNRTLAVVGASVSLPTGTTIISGATVPSGAEAISDPSVNLAPGEVLVLLPGQMLPTGATVLSGVTIPAGSVEVTTPGTTLPTGTVAVPLQCAVLPDGTVIGPSTNGSAVRELMGSASAQRNTSTVMTQEQAQASIMASDEFFMRAQG